MRKAIIGFGCAVAVMLTVSTAAAQQTVRIGLVMSYTGPFADFGAMMDTAVRLYVQKHGDTVAGKKIEFVRKDSGAAGAPRDIAKRLTQDLITDDKVDIVAGFSLTPDALAAADVLTASKKVGVIMNAATSTITAQSAYFVRTAIPVPAAMAALGSWAAASGIKNTATMVPDNGPGIDSEQAFHAAFTDGGGVLAGAIRFPATTPDFSTYLPRLQAYKSEAVYIFVPGGEWPAALGKALTDHGLSPKATRILASGELANEASLKSLGAAAEGIVTAWHYDAAHPSAMNAAFVKDFGAALNGRRPDQLAVSAYDGMHLIYQALAKTNGDASGDTLIAAMKGLSWESPRGPVAIDPETRDIVQTIYLRRVEKLAGGGYGNSEFDKIESVKDPVKLKLKAEGRLQADGTAKP